MSTHTVFQCHKTKWHKNPVSGHEWPEFTFINRWQVHGGVALGEGFFSEKAAQKHADFLNKFCPPEYIKRIQAITAPKE
jgi:hypothetical protein